MFSRFFIERPVFAAVIAIITVIAGAAALGSLPVALYPEITPPTVKVSAVYPGADAQTVSQAVAEPLESRINGVEGMIYMKSTSAADGSYSLTITFEPGTDLDMAAVLVQNRVAVALPKLPAEVTRLGVTTRKQSTNVVMLLALLGRDDRYDDLFLSNYAAMRIRDELARVPGVGDVGLFGAGDYAMRIWVDPAALEAHGITVGDLVAALREQNVQVAAGKVGQAPPGEDVAWEYTVRVRGRLQTVSEFENVAVRTGESGGVLRLRDVARVELAARDYSVIGRYNGQPAALLAVYQLPGANALDVVRAVRAKMDELAESFPPGMRYEVALDTTEFISASIREVIITLLVAILLVIATIWLFLQDWRSTIIPAVAIPVSLVGTFVIMAMLGFTVNMITLFGLVLAIGIVVDDAIVVVENTDRNLQEKGLPPREAAIRAMEEVAGPVVATTLVLLAVFVPAAFMGGMTGGLFRQFALTISGATVISSINALTLSPALCALFLRRREKAAGRFFGAFNRLFGATTRGYVGVVRLAIRRSVLAVLLAAVIGALALLGFSRLPTGFLPEDDSGYLLATATLAESAALDRTYDVAMDISRRIQQVPGVRACVAVVGFSLLDGAMLSNSATFWIPFKRFDEREEGEGQDLAGILGRVREILSGEMDAVGVALVPPSIPGLGSSGGFEMMIEARAGQDAGTLQRFSDAVVAEAAGQPDLRGVYGTFRATTPQVKVDIDREAVRAMGIPLAEVYETLQASLGGTWVNDFTLFGRNYQVRVQAEAAARAHAEDILRLRVRNRGGESVPLRAVADVGWTFGPQVVTRFNTYPAALVGGQAAPGVSSGRALADMEEVARRVLPEGMGFSWSGLSFQEKTAGGVGAVFALAIVFVFLFLAAQYESWTVPLAVILVVPLSLLGTVILVAARGMDVNVYTQIGVVLLVGLAAKNAILIVEFALERRQQGLPPGEAAAAAAEQRFRPILMTSLAFILGTFPLLVATGAGAASRQALGTAVFGGMLAATAFSTLFVPVFFYVIDRLVNRGHAGGRD